MALIRAAPAPPPLLTTAAAAVERARRASIVDDKRRASCCLLHGRQEGRRQEVVEEVLSGCEGAQSFCCFPAYTDGGAGSPCTHLTSRTFLFVCACGGWVG